MEGIIGILGFRFSEKIHAMASVLPHRGKASFYKEDRFALSQLCSYPEKQLFESEEVIVISDARIDNITELKQKVGLEKRESPDLNKLIAIAYLKLGNQLAENITGDFAIAIFDKKKRKITLIRDHMGVRPLFYSFVPGQYLIFASEPKAILTSGFVPSSPNFAKNAEFLCWPSDRRSYSNTTFYNSIHSVLPATLLEIGTGLEEYKETFYWKINTAKTKSFQTRSHYLDAYAQAFKTAVKRRLKDKTGIHISGGLDSSSVFAVASYLNIRKSLFSMHFYPDSPEADEREFVYELISQKQVNHLEIKRSVSKPQAISETQSAIDRPDGSTIPQALKTIPELEWLKKIGGNTILTGHDGDTVIDKGNFYLLDQIVKGNLLSVKKYFESDGSRDFQDRFLIKAAITAYQKKGAIYTLQLISKYTIQGFVNLGVLLKMGKLFIEKTALRKPRKNAFKVNEKVYYPSNLTQLQQEHFMRISSASMIETNEMQNLLGAAYGIEYAHPFLDKDFVELSILMPEELRIGPNRIGRYHFREAMRGILPEKIRLRKSKVAFDKPILSNLILTINLYLKTLIPHSVSFNEWLNAKIELELTLSGNSNEEINKAFKKYQRILFLEIWQRQMANRQ